MRSRLAAAACMFGAGILLAVPPLAHAGHDDDDEWDDDHRGYVYRSHDDHHGGRGHHHPRRRVHRHGDWCDHRDDRSAYGSYYAYLPYARPRAVAYRPYYCRPCDHGWDDRDDFYAHVQRRHAVPFVGIPFSLGRAAWGWVFLGD